MAAISPGLVKPLGIFAGAVQTAGKKGPQSLFNAAQGKKRPAPSSDEDEEEEDSEEDDVVNHGDHWGSEDDADMVDDYGADSNSEDEEEGEEVRFISGHSEKDPCYLVSFQILETVS